MASQSNESELGGFQNDHLECNEKDQTEKSQVNSACQDLGSQEKQVQHQESLLQEQPLLGNQEIITKDENGDSKTSPSFSLFERKDALTLFNMINPGSSCTIEKLSGENKAIFSAVFSHDDKIQASGLGLSEEEAKQDAAENGIKLHVSQVMAGTIKHFGEELEEIDLPSDEELHILRLISSYAVHKFSCERKKLATEMSKSKSSFIEGQKKSDGWFELLIKNQYPSSVLNWKCICSFLQPYLMNACFAKSEQSRLREISSETNVEIKDENVEEKKLPKNASELHPPDLLEIMNPGTCPFEVWYKECSIKMGYIINNKIYTGIGSSKKEAKLEAAKKAMSKIYNVKYENKL